MHQTAITEAHLVLGRVHIDIDYCRIKLQIEHKHWMTTMKQHIAICLTYRVSNQAVTHDTAIDEEVLLICLCS